MTDPVETALRAWYATVRGTAAQETPAAPDPDEQTAPVSLGQGKREAVPGPAEKVDIGAALRALAARQ